MKSVIAVAAAVVAVSTMTGAFAQGGAKATASEKAVRPSVCATSYDPYNEPVTVLRSCGDIIMMLQRVTPLPGGGKAYDYGVYTQKVPPPHFNVLKASDRQLREYDLPTRRELGSGWRAYLSHVRHFAKPTPYLVGVPAARPGANPQVRPETACNWPDCLPQWSGYAAVGHSYNFASAVWEEPAFISDSCSATEFSQWTGIGGFYQGSTHLGQDGTAFGQPGLSAHEAWIETLNGAYSPPFGVGLNATKNQPFSSIVEWDSTASDFDYMMGNEVTGTVWDGNSRKVGADQRSAEVITERPTFEGNPSDITAFDAFQVNDSVAGWGSGSNSFFGNLPASDIDAVSMRDPSGNLMASPGAFIDDNYLMSYGGNCS